MKTNKRMFLVTLLMVIVAGLLSGCASQNYVPDAAFTDAKQAISVKNPVENEKAGDLYVTVFPAFLDAGTWGVESYDGVGFWPVEVEQIGAKPLVGYAFVTDFNMFADFMLQVVVVGRVEKIDNMKIVSIDRDGGKVHNLAGKEFDYDPKRFDNESDYSHKVFQDSGMTLSELQSYLDSYSRKRGGSLSTKSFCEIKVGSPEWTDFKVQLADTLGFNYKLLNGEIREGYLPTKDFKNEGFVNHGVTPTQRFTRNIKAYGPDFAMSAVTSIINGLLDASNGPIEGLYARAECVRGDLKPNFRLMQTMVKNLLQQRDDYIAGLEEKLQKAQGAPWEAKP